MRCVFSAALFSSGDLKTLAKEVSTMLSFRHINIMSLIGVCIDGEMLLLIMPFMSNGSVLEYVRKHKDRLFITGELLRVEVRRINHVDKHVTFVYYIAVTNSICSTSSDMSPHCTRNGVSF